MLVNTPEGRPANALKFDAMLGAKPLRRAAALGRAAAEAGLSGLVVTEAGRTAYLTCGALAVSADIDVLTGIAVAFPRSSMVTALGGLGAGRGHRGPVPPRAGRAGARPHPAPLRQRLRPARSAPARYVLAVKAIFESFRGDAAARRPRRVLQPLLLPAMWSPGAIDVADPPVDIAAVNPWMLRMAGEVADGVHVHPLNTISTYLRETALPNLAAGAVLLRDGVSRTSR